MLNLDQIHTVALAGLVLFAGYGVRRLVPILGRYNIPAPVIGGLLMAGFITAARSLELGALYLHHHAAGAADDRVLHDHRLRREPVAAARRRAGGAAVLRTVDADGGRSEPHRRRGGVRARAASADGRACRLGDADRRPGDGPRVRAAIRDGGRARRGHTRGCRGDGGHRRRRAHRRSDRHAVDRATRPQGRRSPRPAAPHGLATAIVEDRLRERPPRGARRRGRRVVRALEGDGPDPDRHVGGLVAERVVHVDGRDAAGLHRRDARGRRHPQPGRRDAAHRRLAADDRRPRRRRRSRCSW